MLKKVVGNSLLQDKLGICQWFHYGDITSVERSVELLSDLQVKHLRTDISWADASRGEGLNWCHWVFNQFKSINVTIMPCIYLTPPSISENDNTNGPPQRLEAYPEFVSMCISELGHLFGEDVELWNEPNNTIKWSESCDPFEPPKGKTLGRVKQGTMLRMAADVTFKAGKKPLLGGMSPIDHLWLSNMIGHGAMEHCDNIAIHAFPGMWNDTRWNGWKSVVEYLSKYFPGKPIIISEVGHSTAKPEGTEEEEVTCLNELASALIEYRALRRAYFYSLLDLPKSRKEIEITAGGYEMPAEHSLGLVTEHGKKKPAYFRFRELLQN